MITLDAVGDIMLAGKVGDKISQKEEDSLFDNVRLILSSADFTIGNLECPLSERGTPYVEKDFIFRASPEWADFLRKAGFNIVCLANNHILDYGPLALFDTILSLKRAGISHLGAGHNLEEACRPLILNKKGLKICFLAFTYAYTAKKNRPGCCPCDLKFMQKHIESVRPKVDLLIVSIHHGIEYVDYPSRHIISLFRSAVDAGANLVLGHHPHVVQGIETYKSSVIIYSLGNFISDYPDREVRRRSYQKTALSYFTNHPPDIDDMRTTETFIFQCKLDKGGICEHKLIPVKSNQDFQPIVMDEQEAERFLKKLEGISGKFPNLNGPVFDEMDELWERAKEYSLKSMKFSWIAKNIHHLRPKHIKMILPFLKAKVKG